MTKKRIILIPSIILSICLCFVFNGCQKSDPYEISIMRLSFKKNVQFIIWDKNGNPEGDIISEKDFKHRNKSEALLSEADLKYITTFHPQTNRILIDPYVIISEFDPATKDEREKIIRRFLYVFYDGANFYKISDKSLSWTFKDEYWKNYSTDLLIRLRSDTGRIYWQEWQEIGSKLEIILNRLWVDFFWGLEREDSPHQKEWVPDRQSLIKSIEAINERGKIITKD